MGGRRPGKAGTGRGARGAAFVALPLLLLGAARAGARCPEGEDCPAADVGSEVRQPIGVSSVGTLCGSFGGPTVFRLPSGDSPGAPPPPPIAPAGGLEVAVGFGWSDLWHLGLYFHYLRQIDDEGTNVYGTGLTFRAGGATLDWLWLGGAVDLGFRLDDSASRDAAYGVDLFPRFVIDFTVWRGPTWDFDIVAALGPRIAPYLAVDRSSPYWRIDLQALLGVAVLRDLGL